MSEMLVSGAGEVEYEVTITRRVRELAQVRNWLQTVPDGPYGYVDGERIQVRETEVFSQRLPQVNVVGVIMAVNGINATATR
jgi:hypothetical protein